MKKWFRITNNIVSAFLIAALLMLYLPYGVAFTPGGGVLITNQVAYASTEITIDAEFSATCVDGTSWTPEDPEDVISSGEYENVRWRTGIDFGTSAIPDGSTITKVELKINITEEAGSGMNNDVAKMTSKARTYHDADNYSGFDADVDGNEYLSDSYGYYGVGSHRVELLEAARTDLKAQLGADWFSVGWTGTTETENKYRDGDTYLTGNKIQLIVTIVAPTVDVLSPLDDATGVANDTDLVLTFDENVVKGTGNIVIYRASDDSVSESIPVNDARVSIADAVVTIDPNKTFVNNAGYYVKIAATCFDDTSGNPYTGITDNTTWNFTTASTTASLEFVTGLSTPDTRGGIFTDDTYIWIADHKDGLWRADKSDGANAGDVTSDDKKLWDICHSGSYIYGVGSNTLFIYDDINGAVVGSITTGPPYGVYVTGNYAYVASDAGLEVYDVSAPASPSHVRTVQIGLDFVKVRGAGNYLYATAYSDDTLRIFDISTPASSTSLVGTYDPGMSGDIRGLYVDGDNELVYIINDAADLYIVDVSDPSSPATESYLFLQGGNSNLPAGGVSVQGYYAYVCTANGNDEGYLHWIDISDTSNPTLIDSLQDDEFGFNQPYVEDGQFHVAAHDGWKLYKMNGKPDLGLEQAVDKPNPPPEDTVTFTITLHNSGPSEATNIEVTDIVPSGFSYVGGTITGGDSRNESDPAGAGLTWAINSLAAGAESVLTFQAIIHATGNYTNIAQVTACDGMDPDSMPGDGTGDDCYTLVITPLDNTSPTISSGTVGAGNTYIDVAFTEGVYNTDSGSGAVDKTDFSLTFTQNGGNATAVTISSVTNTSDGALVGGETSIRCVLTITGTPTGAETIELKPIENSIYDEPGNPATNTTTTGDKNLIDQTTLIVTTSAATSVDETTATLNGSLDSLGDYSSTIVSFQWGTTSGNLDHETTSMRMTETGTLNAVLTGLAPGTTYYFSATRTVDGVTAYGDELSFATENTPPSANTTASTDVTASSATLNGSLDSLGNYSPVNVSFQWGTTSGALDHETTSQETTETGTFSAGIYISEDTTYYFRIKVEANGNAILYGNELSFIFDNTAVTTSPATNITAISTTLNGVLNSLGGSDSVNVTFQWGTTSGALDHETASQEMTTEHDAFNAEIDLSEEATYYFRSTRTINGVTDYGDELSFTNTTPPSASTQAPTFVEETTATLNGSLDDLGDFTLLKVSLQYGTSSGVYTWETTPQQTTKIHTFNAVLTGLLAGTTYYYRTKATGSVTVYGAEFSFATTGGSTPDPTPAPTPAPTPGGGGGGGGGGGVSPEIKGYYEDMLSTKAGINSSRVILGNLKVTDTEGLFTFEVAKYTKVLTPDNSNKIYIHIADAPPSPPDGFEIVGDTYEFGPSGTTFDSPARLAMSFHPDHLPEHTEYVVLARYTPETGWEELDAERQDGVAGELSSMTTGVDHFTMYAILAKVSPAPPAFAVSSLDISPGQATIGETVTIATEATNTGGTKGSYSLELKIDGVVKAVKEITLDPDQSQIVSFELTDLPLGAHQVQVSDLTAELSIVPLPPTPPLAPAAKPFAYGWLIAVISALAAIAALAFITTRKRAQPVTATGEPAQAVPSPSRVSKVFLAVAAVAASSFTTVRKRLQHPPAVEEPAIVEEPEIVVEELPRVEEPAEAVPSPSRFNKIFLAVAAVAASSFTTVKKRLQHPPVIKQPPVVVPGDLRIYNLRISPNRVKPGEIITVFAEATNDGYITRSCSLVLKIKGIAEAVKEITLSPGQSQKVAFIILKDKPGVYDVDLEDLKGSFTVEEVAAPPDSSSQ